MDAVLSKDDFRQQVRNLEDALAQTLAKPFKSKDLMPLGEILAIQEQMIELLKKTDATAFVHGLETLGLFVQEVIFENVGFMTGMSYVLNYHEYFSQLLDRYLDGEDVTEQLEDKTDRFRVMFGLASEKPKSKGTAVEAEMVIQVLVDEFNDEGLVGEFLSETREGLELAETLLLEVEEDPNRTDLVPPIFRTMHTLKGNAASFQLTAMSFLAHHMEDLLVGIRDGARSFSPVIFEAFFKTIDILGNLVDQLQTICEGNTPTPVNVREAHAMLEKCINEKAEAPLASEATTAEPDADETSTAVAPAEPAAKTEVKPEEKATEATNKRANKVVEMIKVPATKLDELGELIGEMVVALSVLSQNPVIESIADRDARERLDQLDKVTESLREKILGIRMFPVGTVFSKLSRQVRDLSRKSGKQINFVLGGADTLVDKSVIDVIYAPLMHLVRNAIDHGLESEEERLAAGKPAKGKVSLTATHRGDSIIIEITDDGKGLDTDAILAKAVEKGLVKNGENLSESQISNLIFAPGFSTAKKVTDVSGRGVGMDVVKKGIEELRGRINLETKLGKGTTFSIKLPLTTSIIEGLVVRIGESLFVIPILDVSVTVTPKADELKGAQGQEAEMFINAGDLVPIIRLYKLFEVVPDVTDPSQGIVIIINEDGKKYGLLVDELLHRQQVVIKNLGTRFRGLKGISGGTILGNGRVGFILEPHDLIHMER